MDNLTVVDDFTRTLCLSLFCVAFTVFYKVVMLS